MTPPAPARPLRRRGLDRNQVLARVDLPVAADRLLGPPVGRGAARRWVCPHPDHPRDAPTPAVAVFRGRDDVQRWRCRTCGEHGTALDLVMLTQQRDFPEALRLLDELADELRSVPRATETAERPAGARVPREVLLAQFDLRDLADELLGAGKGTGRSRTWRCPLPQHGPQTGRTPPVSISARSGIQRWRCHACGEGGTAIDLVMAAHKVGTGEAFDLLLDRLGGRPLTPVRPAPPPSTPAPPTRAQRAAIAAYVDRCEQLLWSDLGLPGRGFLARRALDEPVLRANRVGYDPGPALLPRVRGLPRRGPAIVLPVLGADNQPVYLQVRYLAPADGRPYGNVTERLAGLSPRVAFPRPPGPEVDTELVLVCEGQLDALSAAQAGYAAAAVLAAGLPDERVARALLDRYPTRRLVLAFDDDTAGRNGAAKLDSLLNDSGVDSARRTVLIPRHRDLNEWLRTSRSEFGLQLRQLIDAASVIPPESPQRSTTADRSPVMPPTADHAVQVWHALPATSERISPAYRHVHTFAVPGELLAEEAARSETPERRGDLPRLAAELAVDVGGYDDSARYREPYAALARDYRASKLRPIGIDDVLVVTAADGTTTSLEWTANGMRRLSSTPALLAAPALQPPNVNADPSTTPSDHEQLEYTVRVLYLLPEASLDAGSLAQVYTAVVPAGLVQGLRARERAAGRDIDAYTAAAAVVYELGNRDPDDLVARRTQVSTRPNAMVDRAPSPGDVLLVGTPDGQVSSLRATSHGWERLPEPPPFLALEPGAPGRLAAASASRAYRVRVLHPVPSQVVQGMTMQARDFDHVVTLDIPAELVQAAVEREVSFGEPPFPAARAAEIAFTVGNADPADLSEAFAPLAADYQAAQLRSLSVGDVLLVDAPNATSTALLCDTAGWRELQQPPTFGPPGHNPDPPQITYGPDGPTMSPEAKTELLTGLHRMYGVEPKAADLGPDL